MKALIVDSYGQPAEAHFGEIAAPSVRDGFLLVHVHAASVNPFDVKVITGTVKDWMPVEFPYVPGMDGSGTVAEIGKGVSGWNEGDPVFGMFATGTLAEYALISASEKRLARKPEALDFEHAAAIPETGLTAMTILRAGNVGANQTVLIIGATGGIGTFATQLAKAQGAHVIATGKPEDVDYLAQLGVDEVVDYSAGDPIAQTRQKHPGGVDVVIDLINAGDALLHDADALRTGGTLVSSLNGPKPDAYANNISVHYIQMKAQEGDLEGLARRAVSKQLRVEIAKRYDLSQSANALVDLVDPAKHTRGKRVVRI